MGFLIVPHDSAHSNRAVDQPVKWCSGFILILSVLAAFGCSRQDESAPPPSPSTTPSVAMASTSTLDEGPRANEGPRDETLAKEGEQLFKTKGCSACHAFGKRVTGPDLAGVTGRRTAKWIESQILHPEKMVKEDPITRKMFAEFALQMPNQGLTEAQARAIVEYFKHQDHETGESD
jgi:mono/diheme cytochrome c family protein